MLVAIGVLAVDSAFADQGSSDGDDTIDKRPLTTNSVSNKGNKEQVYKWLANNERV